MNRFFLNLRNKFRLLTSDLPVLFMASRDQRTPISSKLLLGLTIVYFISPVDLVPDVVPFLGWVDDLLVTPFLVSAAIKTVPHTVLTEIRARISQRKSRIKRLFFIFLILIVSALSIYYGYQYFVK